MNDGRWVDEWVYVCARVCS